MADDSPYGPPPGADDSALSAGMAAVAAAAQGALPSGLDKRAPRFSWTPAYEATFFRSLCESVQLGLRENHSFKPQAWDRAAAALRDKHGAFPNKAHLVNKSDNARKKFRLWRGLREHPDFLYNPVTRTVTASEDAWKEHIEKEPLSRSLRGRPFEHEEYMEILYPDVIGSGGAPKRIMKPRRKGPDNLPGEEPDNTPGTGVLDLAVDAYGNTATRPTPNGTPAAARPQQQNTAPRPTTTTTTTVTASVPSARPLVSNSSSTALTPPEDTPTTHTRKRFAPDVSAHFNADKRRRGAGGLTHHETGLIVEEGLTAVAEALKISRLNQSPRWPEQALEIFFREFADEDLDLQIKIAEKALTDENKAMVFVKMPPAVRKHWVSRLREVHARSGGSVTTSVAMAT